MVLNREPKYPSRRTYVVKLAHDAKPDALSGRLEAVTTGSQRRFESGHELLDAIARDLESAPTAGPADPDGGSIDGGFPGLQRAPQADVAADEGFNGTRSPTMNMNLDDPRVGRSALSLEELDRELARLALLCRIRILGPGVIERVLRNDSSVCGTDNATAFGKLRSLLMVHFALRQDLVDSIGQAKTAGIEAVVIERLKKSFPDLGAAWPPA